MMTYMSFVAVIVFYSLGLIGAFVLFKILKANAVIKKPGIQIGGALAGFVIIFVLLFRYYYLDSIPLSEYNSIIKEKETEIEKLKEEIKSINNKWVVKHWTISGYISKEGSSSYDGILSSYQPPSPSMQIIPENGLFYLHNVRIIEGSGWPTFLFQCKGYIPDEYKINESDTIDEKNFEIKLNRKIVLEKMDGL